MGWLKQSHEKSLLGQLFVKQGLISEEQLAKAIDQQKKTGQRLGDIFAEWNVITQNHVHEALRKQRHLRLAATIATALLAPLEAYAVAAAPIPVPMVQVRSSTTESEAQSGLRSMTADELDDVSAQGLMDNFLNRSSRRSSNDKGLEVLGDVAKIFNPLFGFLEAETTIKDVVYDPSNASAVINKDGSITLSMPSSIGELSFQHIRVRGSTGPSFGSILIKDIDLRGTTLTLRPR